MASLSPNATLVSSAMDADGVNGVFTYNVTDPAGIVRKVTYGPCTRERADNLASGLADGGYLAAQTAGHIQGDWTTS
jgi:hypothetical protein